MANLTKNVRLGLDLMSGYIDAGGATDMFGFDEDSLHPKERADWLNVQRAMRWIAELKSASAREGTEAAK